MLRNEKIGYLSFIVQINSSVKSHRIARGYLSPNSDDEGNEYDEVYV